MAAEAFPSIRCTALTFAPALIDRLATVCRRSWMVSVSGSSRRSPPGGTRRCRAISEFVGILPREPGTMSLPLPRTARRALSRGRSGTGPSVAREASALQLDMPVDRRSRPVDHQPSTQKVRVPDVETGQLLQRSSVQGRSAWRERAVQCRSASAVRRTSPSRSWPSPHRGSGPCRVSLHSGTRQELVRHLSPCGHRHLAFHIRQAFPETGVTRYRRHGTTANARTS